jgi:hypothetical protein
MGQRPDSIYMPYLHIQVEHTVSVNGGEAACSIYDPVCANLSITRRVSLQIQDTPNIPAKAAAGLHQTQPATKKQATACGEPGGEGAGAGTFLMTPGVQALCGPPVVQTHIG